MAVSVGCARMKALLLIELDAMPCFESEGLLSVVCGERVVGKKS